MIAAQTRFATLVLTALGLGCPAQQEPVPIGVVEKEQDAAESEAVDKEAKRAPKPASLSTKIAKFTVVELQADVSALRPGEQKALEELIAAAQSMDPIFDRQAYAGNPKLDKQLSGAIDADAETRYRYYKIMRGPWDRLNGFEPFAVDKQRPPGAGLYPESLTADDLKAWIQAHPQQKPAFESSYTIVERSEQELVTQPYSNVYKEWLKPAAGHLRAAAESTHHPSLKRFLKLRADAFATDDYFESDKAWVDVDSLVEISIGPYGTSEDLLLGLKASFGAFVTVSDRQASAALAKFKGYLPAMEARLLVDKPAKTTPGVQGPIVVADIVFTSGDARKPPLTLAVNLPRDERVRQQKGSKVVLLRNLIDAEFQKIVKRIGGRLLVADLRAHLSADAFFHQVLFRELSRGLGPGPSEEGGKGRVALRPSYAALEECKADATGAYNALFMIEKGEFDRDFRNKLLTTYFAGLFRTLRLGVAQAHGKAAAVQLNRYLEQGAATFDAKSKRFSIDFAKFEASITSLVAELVKFDPDGDDAAVEAFFAKNGVVSDAMEKALRQVNRIPLDIRPVYPLAGESPDGNSRRP